LRGWRDENNSQQRLPGFCENLDNTPSGGATPEDLKLPQCTPTINPFPNCVTITQPFKASRTGSSAHGWFFRLLLYEVLDSFWTTSCQKRLIHFQHTHQKPSILVIACCSHFSTVTKLVIIGFLHVAESSANATTRGRRLHRPTSLLLNETGPASRSANPSDSLESPHFCAAHMK
jgi:hypothetical protein